MSYFRQLLSDKGITLYQQDRFPLDNYYFEPFQDLGLNFDTSVFFETDPPKSNKKRIPLSEKQFSLFKFFMDGSRKTYKIGDIITPSDKFMPVVAGQVRAGCCKRDESKYLNKHIIKTRNYLLLSSVINKEDFDSIQKAYKKFMASRIDLEVETYDYSKFAEDTPTNAAIASIHKKMLDLEVSVLSEMVQSNDLDTDKVLLLDGSLQFISQKFNPDIFYNVIGVSKHFNPNLTGILRGKVHIGSLLAKLEFGERTPVIRTTSRDERYTYGSWYLKIRETRDVRNPLEGVIKVEKMALNEHLERGFETSIIDNISESLLYERIPTCHGNDTRWANHLYPVYLTEKLVKSTFLSDAHFVNLF
jgi:hypothetical protein